jgi:hypothetical protein
MSLLELLDILAATGKFTVELFFHYINELISNWEGGSMMNNYEIIIQANDIVKKYTPSHIETLTGRKPDTDVYNDITSRINKYLCNALALKIEIAVVSDKTCTFDYIRTIVTRIFESDCIMPEKMAAATAIIHTCYNKDRIGTVDGVIGKTNYASEVITHLRDLVKRSDEKKCVTA